MYYENMKGKCQDVILYMIINIDYDRDVYISKDTAIAYSHEEDKSCKYLEVNEVMESTDVQNLTPRKRKILLILI